MGDPRAFDIVIRQAVHPITADVLTQAFRSIGELEAVNVNPLETTPTGEHVVSAFVVFKDAGAGARAMHQLQRRAIYPNACYLEIKPSAPRMPPPPQPQYGASGGMLATPRPPAGYGSAPMQPGVYGGAPQQQPYQPQYQPQPYQQPPQPQQPYQQPPLQQQQQYQPQPQQQYQQPQPQPQYQQQPPQPQQQYQPPQQPQQYQQHQQHQPPAGFAVPGGFAQPQPGMGYPQASYGMPPMHYGMMPMRGRGFGGPHHHHHHHHHHQYMMHMGMGGPPGMMYGGGPAYGGYRGGYGGPPGMMRGGMGGGYPRGGMGGGGGGVDGLPPGVDAPGAPPPYIIVSGVPLTVPLMKLFFLLEAYGVVLGLRRQAKTPEVVIARVEQYYDALVAIKYLTDCPFFGSTLQLHHYGNYADRTPFAPPPGHPCDPEHAACMSFDFTTVRHRGRPNGHGGVPGRKFPPSVNMFVGNLFEQITDDEVRDIFTSRGFRIVEYVRKSPTHSVISLASVSEAVAALIATVSIVIKERFVRTTFSGYAPHEGPPPRDLDRPVEHNPLTAARAAAYVAADAAKAVTGNGGAGAEGRAPPPPSPGPAAPPAPS
jgi:hypothetical protein